ncbi:DUF1254 domain-containing protein [Cellvibrio sp. NN19]|uniref:DUF1254 domain-containing protein n=1 Tax=Cellvibrio chitinivorans TaxID=3102792 RepID=UPI002B414E39|nr:DUF1254 domain-containing protein [Cellvibrio sp. NN19]
MKIKKLAAATLTGVMAMSQASMIFADTPTVPAVNTTPAASIPGTPEGTTMPLDYARLQAEFIYLWGWPMANTHNRIVTIGKAPEPGLQGGILPVAPNNHLSMLTDYLDPAQRFVAAPNQDVVYGMSTLRLDKEPVVVQVPDFGKRFWVFQLADQRTDGFGKLGSMYNSKPGFYLLVGPDWKGTVPKGIEAVFRSPTQGGFVLPRLFVDDTPQDKQAIQPLINGIGVYPLSKFDGKVKITDWSKLPKFPAAAGSSGETQWVDPDGFFDLLPTLLDEVPPLPGEEAIYTQARSLLAAAKRDPAVMDVLKEVAQTTEKDMIKAQLFEWRNQGLRLPTGWTMQVNAAQWGTDYLTRMSAAKANIFSNAPNETMYYALDLGPDGKRLNGKNDYTITFPEGGVPVKGFWSLTMYNKEHFFEPNDINRYSVGTKNKDLNFAQDGSLTIYLSHKKPKDPVKAANWLPSPKGEFSIYIRAYWPEQVIVNRQWIPPAVVKGR